MSQDIRLNRQAEALLMNLQKQLGPVSAQAESAIIGACAAQGVQKLSAEDLAKALIQALPDQKALIQTAEKKALCYHPDGKNAKFLTQILELKVEKEFANVYVPQPPPARVARDPYISTFSMDPKADFLLLFNARDIDKKGNPLLMKIVARDRADVSQLDLSQYRKGANAPDVTRVGDDCDFIEISDTDEVEFTFGDPLKQVSIDPKGNELSTSVKTNPTNTRTDRWFQALPAVPGTPRQPDLNAPHPNIKPSVQVGEHLDQTPVATFDDRVRLEAKIADEFVQSGGWLHSPLSPTASLSLVVERGFMYEPGSQALFSTYAGQTKVSIADDDAQLLGNARTVAKYQDNVSLGNALKAGVSAQVKAATPAVTSMNLGVGETLLGAFPHAASLTIAGQAFKPFGTAEVKEGFAAAKVAIDKIPLPDDPDQNGQRVRLTLQEGFLSAAGDASIKGWKMVAGYTDAQGKWHGTKVVQLEEKQANKTRCFEIDIDDAPGLMKQNGVVELRVFNADNVPAESIKIPLKVVKWGADAA